MDFKTILVLDDDPQFHKLIVPVLTGRGHRVLSAHTGSEASELVSRDSIDLAIVDGQLPDVTGIDWITNLRAKGSNIIIMFVSAYWRDAQSYHKLTKELNVSLVLHKPVLASVFAAEVDMLLGKNPAAAAHTHDVEDTLLALRSEYARELPVRLEELSSLFHQLKGQPDNLFMRGEARTHAHKLRGTAASYGFPGIGDAAAQIEDAIIALRQDLDENSQLLAHIEKLIEDASAQATKAAKSVQDSRPAKQPLFGSEGGPSTGNIATILVVDDDAAFLDYIEQLGRQHEVEIVRASSASEALDLACITQVDAALIDVELGSRDETFRLAAELRLLPGYSDLPLAFLSGTGHIEKKIDVNNVGECLYLEKTMKADALQYAVHELVAIKQATKSRVLIIDDDVDFLKRIAFVLNYEGLNVRTLDTTMSILDEMQEFMPDILLLDVMMPGVSGFDICRMLRTVPRWRDLPIMFLTAYTDVDTRVACLRCGGDDYLPKPVVNEELLTRLKMRLERARLMKERVDRDNITGLLLRRPFMEQLAGMISEACRHGWSVSIVMLHLDQLMERHRHMVADTVLGAAGSLLTKRLRTEDLKGRWGEDKIILAFRDEQAGHVQDLINKVVDEFTAMTFPAENGNLYKPIVARGIVRFPEDGESIHELLAAADFLVQDSTTANHNAGKPIQQGKST